MNPGQAPNCGPGGKYFGGRKKFPMDCVEHLAKCSCQCQGSGLDVRDNKHFNSCMVGKAQAYLGKKVTIKAAYRG
jgi:hypothetical protein